MKEGVRKSENATNLLRVLIAEGGAILYFFQSCSVHNDQVAHRTTTSN